MRRLISLLQKILPLIFWVILMIGFDPLSIAVITICSAFFHELGHVIAIYLLEKRIALPFARKKGFAISLGMHTSYKNELIIALSGPIFNLLAFIVCTSLKQYANGYLSLLAIINLMTFVSNMLPLRGYDGHLALYSLIAIIKDHETAEKILSPISFVFSTVLVFFSLFLILKIGEGFWIFAIFFSLLLEEIFKSNNSSKIEN